jgi:uncharacterized protein YcbX
VHVAALTRYPVKSVVGEDLAAVNVDRRGVEGDRLWAVRDADGKLGSGKSSIRFRKMDGLLSLSASYDGPTPVVVFPDGTSARGDDPEVHERLSRHVGRAVRLAREDDVPHFDEADLHLLTTSSLARIAELHGRPVDARRARANLLVDTGTDAGFDEDDWLGRTVRIGDVELRILRPMERCVMVTMPQIGLPEERGLLARIGEANDTCLGLVAEVVAPGRMRMGDPVVLEPRAITPGATP